MADPISLALGITPLVLSAIKGLKAVRSTLKALRGHDRAIRRLRRSFTTQSHVFLDECHLLLQQVADPDDVVFMLEDGESELWSDPSLDEKLKEHLGRKFEEVKEIVEEIHSQLKTLDGELNRTLHPGKQDVKLTTSEKVREAFDLLSNKTDYEENIDYLKELNQEFKRLRRMAKEIQSSQILAKTHSQKRIPKEYRIRGEYAKSFYNALRYCWSCTDVEHTEHYMALALNCGSGHDMRIILQRAQGNSFSPDGNALTLSIRPQSLPPRGADCTIGRVDAALTLSDVHVQPLKRIRLGSDRWLKRLERPPPSPPEYSFQTTLVDSQGGSTEMVVGTVDQPQQSTMLTEADSVESLREPIDLRKSHNVCGALLRLAEPSSKLVGFLDTPDSIRHALTVGGAMYGEVSGSDSGKKALPLLKILENALDADLGVTQQLRLVLQLAKGHLQLHWTPWWRQYWSLSDLSYFPDSSTIGTTDLSDCLKSLHIGTRLDFETLNFDTSTFCLDPEVETALLTHGIRNLSLYCLGIALLQIGRWDPLANAVNDVVAVRKLAARNGRLGPRYQALTQKCIECDFGEGSDLGNPQLQGTVYESVVCELESLIGVLEKI
ncbi:hypothetical protein F5B22DRAFT_529482 [Xylaria bambusicola]|uniref:uncharacterized protein n=1 Tax=Xylaria bambusicola TaxID=326684 RepID=UPI002007AAA1|nr:uncharacterized protein F5B22DRAFT_529482 [Xylaria bambusicola]KAI0505353.1 hypothetical protein F5B22DRAFT_529482 [Xylaria bambusicola]